MITEIERDAIIRTVYGEARGEHVAGQEAVASVILNRADDPSWWGDDIFSVCHAAFQFSCWNGGDVNSRMVVSLHPTEAPAYHRISKVVDGVLDGRRPDPTAGATHYKRVGTVASWDKVCAGKPSVTIGRHIFFKLGPRA